MVSRVLSRHPQSGWFSFRISGCYSFCPIFLCSVSRKASNLLWRERAICEASARPTEHKFFFGTPCRFLVVFRTRIKPTLFFAQATVVHLATYHWKSNRRAKKTLCKLVLFFNEWPHRFLQTRLWLVAKIRWVHSLKNNSTS